MRGIAAICVAFAVVVAPATAHDAVVSWKKSANSYHQFVQDSATCGLQGYLRDVSNDESAKKFVRGWQTADDNLNRGATTTAEAGESWSDTQRRTQPARQMREVQQLHVEDVERCLQRRGYARFTLSRDQAKKLSKLQRGSEARRQYLYKLSSE